MDREPTVAGTLETAGDVPFGRVRIRHDSTVKITYVTVSGGLRCALADDLWDESAEVFPVTYRVLLQPLLFAPELGGLKEFLGVLERDSGTMEEVVYGVASTLKIEWFNFTRGFVMCEERHPAGRSRDVVCCEWDNDPGNATSRETFDAVKLRLLFG